MITQLPEALLRSDAYAHPVSEIRLVETHMSWVFLTGEFAYKVKKPVRFDFADFSDLAERERFCHRELDLNRRFAPELYVGVTAIRSTPDGVRVQDTDVSSGPVIDWAVQMHQFPSSEQCDYAVATGRLSKEQLTEFGRELARKHASGARCESQSVNHAVLDNFSTLARIDLPEADADKIEQLREQTSSALARHSDLLARRQAFARRCHGDLHLGNLVLIRGRIVPFDCLEFSDLLSQTDVWADVAFLYMDLCSRDQAHLAYAFVDGYLDESGDYEGAILLDLYANYRAMVRAKVNALRYQQTRDQDSLQQMARYVSWAHDTAGRQAGSILLANGLSGSGKSHWSRQLATDLGAVRIRSDVLRKSMAGLAGNARSNSGVAADLYAPARSAETYGCMARLAVSIAQTGEDVIVDAASLRRDQREIIYRAARAARIDYSLLVFVAQERTLRRRIRERGAQGSDASEADGAVLTWQLDHHDEPEAQERPLTFDTEAGTLEELIELVQR